MEVFEAYAKYYDLLYEDKDYGAEVEYVEKLIKKYKPDSKKILDLGCGTGKHDLLLSEKGYFVTGIEISHEMIEAANKNLKANIHLSSKLSFIQGDIRNISINGKFDVITALFHVMSYQISNEDFKLTLDIVKEHLKPDGLFIFDFWYGPAVLTEKPQSRIKKLENDEIQVERFAEPDLKVNENIVDVRYKLFVKEKNNGHVNEINETHSMRYLFIPEIKLFLDRVSLNLIHSEEWLTQNELSDKSWSALAIASKSNQQKNI